MLKYCLKNLGTTCHLLWFDISYYNKVFKITVFKVFVPVTHYGVKGWFFNMVCTGNTMSIYHKGLMLLKNATSVNKNLDFDDVCKEKHVFVAYNNQLHIFEVSNITGEMVEGQVDPTVLAAGSVAYEWEIQKAFFRYNNIKPHWLNANYTWGTLNETTDQWSGAVGMIQRDEADYAIFGFAGTYPRSKVAAFTPGLAYTPYYWFTRYPLELSPIWNLLRLFTKATKSQKSIFNLF